jgi:ATP-dependent Clp protease protease subunit
MLFKHNMFFGEKAAKKQKLLQMFQDYQNLSNSVKQDKTHKTISNLLANLAQKDFSANISTKLSSSALTPSGLGGSANFAESSEKILGQRNLRREFNLEKNFSYSSNRNMKSFNYLNSSSFATNSQSEFRDYYRKQTERALMEEESKKVFVIINSFGGSVGNGITVHDALQFIKAGSLTLALGVAASAASLALAGGTIGERYVTEGCHTMIHQPEGGLQGQASDIWIDSQEIMKIRLDVAEIYSLSTYRPRHKILRDLDRDFYLTATETIQYGLADEIATNEVMSDIIEMTSKVWDYHDSKQQRLLESRESASSGLDTQTQN